MATTSERATKARTFLASIWPDRAYVNRRAHSLWTTLHGSVPEFQSSCCLFRLGDDIAVVTAAHALPREEGRQYFIGTGNRFFELVGMGRWGTTIESGRKGEDALDIEVVLLDRVISAAMPRVGLVVAADVEAQSRNESDGAFVVSGYPASRQRVRPTLKQTDSELHSLVLSSDIQGRTSAANQSINPLHLELAYDQRAMVRDGEIITSVAPKGMSGAGVWYVDRTKSVGDRRRLQLAGILIERVRNERRVLLATRIIYPLRLILGLDAEYRQFLPHWVSKPL